MKAHKLLHYARQPLGDGRGVVHRRLGGPGLGPPVVCGARWHRTDAGNAAGSITVQSLREWFLSAVDWSTPLIEHLETPCPDCWPELAAGNSPDHEGQTMAAKKKSRSRRTQDREFMDQSGAPKDFLGEQAEADRQVAKAKHFDTGFVEARKTATLLLKAIAHGSAIDDEERKHQILVEVGDLFGQGRDDSRRAVRNAAGENRNLQQ